MLIYCHKWLFSVIFFLLHWIKHSRKQNDQFILIAFFHINSMLNYFLWYFHKSQSAVIYKQKSVELFHNFQHFGIVYLFLLCFKLNSMNFTMVPNQSYFTWIIKTARGLINCLDLSHLLFALPEANAQAHFRSIFLPKILYYSWRITKRQCPSIFNQLMSKCAHFCKIKWQKMFLHEKWALCDEKCSNS